jgi:Rv0078B-related antitoxin
MTPEEALQKQVERYRSMTGEERLKVSLDLHELACEIARDGIRHQHPEASPAQVEHLLRQRIALAQRL